MQKRATGHPTPTGTATRGVGKARKPKMQTACVTDHDRRRPKDAPYCAAALKRGRTEQSQKLAGNYSHRQEATPFLAIPQQPDQELTRRELAPRPFTYPSWCKLIIDATTNGSSMSLLSNIPNDSAASSGEIKKNATIAKAYQP